MWLCIPSSQINRQVIVLAPSRNGGGYEGRSKKKRNGGRERFREVEGEGGEGKGGEGDEERKEKKTTITYPNSQF